MSLEDSGYSYPTVEEWRQTLAGGARHRHSCGLRAPAATLWLSTTYRADHFGGAGDLFTRVVEMAHLPEIGGEDRMELYARPGYKPGEGPMWGFKRRYWDLDGTLHLELQEMHIDPQGPLLDHFQRRTLSPASRRQRIWLTDQDGDPRPLLLASGWSKY